MSEECILIHDAFPKAAHHALVLPREPTLHDVRSLNRAHIPLLTRMKVRDILIPALKCAPTCRIGCVKGKYRHWRGCSERREGLIH